MTSAAALVGVGIPPQAAERLGFTVSTPAGVGTTQAGSAPLTSNMSVLTTSAGATAFLLQRTTLGRGPIVVTNPSVTTALVFPQSGESINGGAANASVSIPQNATRLFFKTGSTTWISVLGA